MLRQLGERDERNATSDFSDKGDQGIYAGRDKDPPADETLVRC